MGRHKLVAELFQQAVGQLGDEKLEVRLFAIYSLRRISEDHPDYKRAIIELLTAFVRTNSNKWGDSVPPLDVLEIFKILELNLASDS